jgi:hypothetical protein
VRWGFTAVFGEEVCLMPIADKVVDAFIQAFGQPISSDRCNLTWLLTRESGIPLVLSLVVHHTRTMLQLAISDSEQYQHDPMMHFLINTMDEAQSHIAEVLNQWKHPNLVGSDVESSG